MSYASPSSDPLYAPLYGAGPGEAFVRFFKKYFAFTGRASRSEYWWVFLISSVISVLFVVIDTVASGGFAQANRSATGVGDILGYVWSAATLIPSLSISWRRLHDADHSGAWTLIGLVPVVGWIVLLVFYVSGPKPAGARFDL